MNAATLQRTEALRAANRVRSVRHQLKQHIRNAGSLQDSMSRAADALECPVPEIDTMRVEALLKSIYRLGGAKASRLLLQSGIPAQRSIGALTLRQRDALVVLLRGGQ